MEGKAEAKGSAAENTLLRKIHARRDWILQTAGHNNILTMAVLRNRLLLPQEGIASKVIKGGEDTLRLVKSTEAGSLGGAIASPIIDGRRPARRTLRFASPVRGGQHPRGGARQSAPTLGPRGPAFAMSWRPMVYPPGSNILQATAKTRVRAPDSSIQALRYVARLSLTSCGIPGR